MCTIDFKDVENNRWLCWEEDRKFGLVFTTKLPVVKFLGDDFLIAVTGE